MRHERIVNERPLERDWRSFFIRLLAGLSFWLCLPSGEAQALENRLLHHPSPYLAMHGDDPVAWQEWNADTVALARREHKLLYVSVGYFACHWCHVMQRESYRNAGIAAELNRNFIPVKVDRELDTALDAALQAFSERLSGTAGWPLNAFVTPDGYPVFVMLYAPPAEFHNTLTRIAGLWSSDRARLQALARSAAAVPAALKLDPPPGRAVLTGLQSAFLQQLRAQMDDMEGGFGDVRKFPMTPQLDLLLELLPGQPDTRLENFLRLTLDRMAARGLHDAVQGGFFRYAVDPGWETPHFEKMLYDNAQLAQLYLRAADRLNEPRYRQIALETLDFMQRDLAAPDGGYYTSTSAVDEQGREGAAYLWPVAELKRVLDPAEFDLARRLWGLDRPSPLEYGYLPISGEPAKASEQAVLRSALLKLRRVRAQTRVPLDTKVNAGLNGLALSALSLAMRSDPGYRPAAARQYDYLVRQMRNSGELVKTVAEGKRIGQAELEDYAYVAVGMLDYADATGDATARKQAVKLVRKAWKLFAGAGGWRRAHRPLLATIQAEPVLLDDVTPSPSAMLLLASLRQDDPGLVRQAREALRWRQPGLTGNAFNYPGQIGVLMRALELPPTD